MFINHTQKILLLLCITVLAYAACTKTEVAFGNDGTDDPNITYFDNYAVDLATYKIDSFITSGHSDFTIGHHVDTLFGTVTGSTYAEVQLPVENTVKDKDVSFDSLVIALTPNGNYYGDTTLPFAVNVNRLQEKIENEDVSNVNFYNPRKIAYDAAPIGQLSTLVKPTKPGTITIRLSDALGAELLTKFKTNATQIRTSDDWLKYFKGVCINSDTSITKAMYYFTDSVSSFMRLYYKLNGAIPQQKTLDFSMNISKQFNNIFYHYTGTKQTAFTPLKNQLKASSVTGNKAYLHSNMASYIKITFPTLLSLKELHPYIKVIKAELDVRPTPFTYSYPYTLPPQLNLYTSDVNNNLVTLLTDKSGATLTGNLYVDQLYGDNTHYSFDITSFVNTYISEGQFSDLALMLTPVYRLSDSQLERLVINDQKLANGIQLKLYVLGL